MGRSGKHGWSGKSARSGWYGYGARHGSPLPPVSLGSHCTTGAWPTVVCAVSRTPVLATGMAYATSGMTYWAFVTPVVSSGSVDPVVCTGPCASKVMVVSGALDMGGV